MKKEILRLTIYAEEGAGGEPQGLFAEYNGCRYSVNPEDLNVAQNYGVDSVQHMGMVRLHHNGEMFLSIQGSFRKVKGDRIEKEVRPVTPPLLSGAASDAH